MAMRRITAGSIIALAAAGVALSGCVQSQLRLSDDLGRAVGQNVAAQIADPDAAYKGKPMPASDGRRTGLAQDRYERNAVIRPASTSTSSSSSGGGEGGGGGGSGGSGAGPNS
jgi:uncharacterized membrane protein YgcG